MVRNPYRPSLAERLEDLLWVFYCVIFGVIACGLAVIVTCVAVEIVRTTKW
jgi:hypothetical protein